MFQTMFSHWKPAVVIFIEMHATVSCVGLYLQSKRHCTDTVLEENENSEIPLLPMLSKHQLHLDQCKKCLLCQNYQVE